VIKPIREKATCQKIGVFKRVLKFDLEVTMDKFSLKLSEQAN